MDLKFMKSNRRIEESGHHSASYEEMVHYTHSFYYEDALSRSDSSAKDRKRCY